MAFTRMTGTTTDITNLDNKPNLTPAALKAKFDESAGELKTAHNAVADELEDTTAAALIGAAALSEGDTSEANVQAKMAYLLTEIGEAALENIPDDSITTAKYKAASVTETVLADDAVTEDKIEDGAVTTAKLAEGAITTAILPEILQANLEHSQQKKVLDSANGVFTTAGSYTYTVPSGVTELGVFMIGGGGSGGAAVMHTAASDAASYALASGGGSGYAKAMLLTVTPAEEIAIVVGAGGAYAQAAISGSTAYAKTNGNAGGTTSVDGNTVAGGSGGQGGYYTSGVSSSYTVNGGDGGTASNTIDKTYVLAGRTTAPIRGQQGYYFQYNTVHDGISDSAAACINPHEPEKWYLGAGGGAHAICNNTLTYQTAPALTVGTAGAGSATYRTTAGTVTGNTADGYGSGGGGTAVAVVASSVPAVTARSGAGADGAVFIYY